MDRQLRHRGAMAAVHLSAAELRPKLTAGLEIAAENAPKTNEYDVPTDWLMGLAKTASR